MQFVHRKDQDGSTKSICGYCAVTVAVTADPLVLSSAESGHECCPYEPRRKRKDVLARIDSAG
jgi:hypothetical protein